VESASGGLQWITTVNDFAYDVRDELARYLASGEVYFRGSFAEASYDENSEVDLQSDVHFKLDGRFWSALEERLTRLYGPALIRYDPV
jgi:hypothetical protein